MTEQNLMTREEFREAVFARDGHRCVFCKQPAVDAHHILERRLWPDGGYYLNNGASVCAVDHIRCETTELSVEAVRQACGITKIIVPPHLYADQAYDKWGNPVLPSGQRLKGELFFDESVQKALINGRVLDLFTQWVKYPRTHHLPWSEGVTDDDRIIGSLSAFLDQRVIVSVKMDGENTTLYRDYIHARSIDGRSHPSRDWVKQFWSTIQADIPEGWRVCGENLYAKHSIGYDNLPTYFMGFSIWNERNVCLGWDETLEWFDLLGITPVPLVFDGIFDEKTIRALWNNKDWEKTEGYVVRLADQFNYGEFRHKAAKFVRKGHVQTAKHWMYGQQVERNQLAV
ncbi:MAG: RNA ligase family protein [Candidatus Nanopelagicales bacterium]